MVDGSALFLPAAKEKKSICKKKEKKSKAIDQQLVTH